MRNIFNTKKHIWLIAVSAIFIIISYTLILFFYNAISFDEAYNLQVPVNLATNGQYASNGSQFDGTPKLFDPFISTGPTLLAPIAFMFKFFGVGVWQYRIITFIIYIIFCILTVLFVMKATNNPRFTKIERFTFGVFAATLSIAFLNTSMVGSEFFFVIAQGEALAIVFALMSILLLQYKKIYWAAFAVGLAVLTKFLFLLLIPFFLLELYYVLKGKFQTKLKKMIIALLLVAVPSILFEFYRLYAFGFNLGSYKESLREFIHFFKIAGGDPTTVSAPLLIILDRLRDLAKIDIFSIFILFILTLLASIVILVKLWQILQKPLKKELAKLNFIKYSNVPYLYIIGSVVLWMFWWLFISSTGWTRYAIPPMVLLIIASVTFIYMHDKRNKQLLLAVVILTLISSIVIIFNNKLEDNLKSQQLISSRINNEFGEKDLYHYGWWQNPEVQFLTSRNSISFKSQADAPNAWLLLSNIHKRMAPEDYNKLILSCNEIIELGYYRICKV